MVTAKSLCDAIQVISEAFSSMGGDPHDGGRLGWPTICAKLQSMGEQVSEEELVHCLEVQKSSHFQCTDKFPKIYVSDHGIVEITACVYTAKH